MKRKPKYPSHRNLVGADFLKKRIVRDVNRLKLEADLQAVWSGNVEKLVTEAGSILFITSYAAGECSIDPEEPDMRIMRGMASALGDIQERPASLEQNRAAIVSGIAAIERTLPRVSVWALGLGAVELDRCMASAGFGTQKIAELHKVTTEKEAT